MTDTEKLRNMSVSDMRSKSSEELTSIAAQLRQTKSFLQNEADPSSRGYKKAPFKLIKGRPHPKFIRKQLARVLTILRERNIILES